MLHYYIQFVLISRPVLFYNISKSDVQKSFKELYMTIGERIHTLRKAKGLSQEEIAKKILVSRQTVSQWETDQTAPSIDNIYRLREVFGISFDELFWGRSDHSQPIFTEPALEEYETVYPQNILSAAVFIVYKGYLYFLFCAVFIAMIGGAFLFVKGVPAVFSAAVLGFGLGLSVLLSAVCAAFFKKKNETRCILRVFSNKFTVYTFDKTRELASYTIGKNEIKSFWQSSKYIVFMHSKRFFLISRDEIQDDSLLYSYFEGAKQKSFSADKPYLDKTCFCLFLLSVFSLAAVTMGALAAISGQSRLLDVFWVIWLFLPAPVISVVLGVILNIKKIRNIKNIVAGLLASALIISVGSIPGISDIARWQKWSNTQIPLTSKYTKAEIRADGYTLYTLEFADPRLFEKSISGNGYWNDILPVQMISCLPSSHSRMAYEYCFIYNISLNQHNQVPPKTGTFRFAFFSYDVDSGTLQVEEYKKRVVVYSNNQN